MYPLKKLLQIQKFDVNYHNKVTKHRRVARIPEFIIIMDHFRVLLQKQTEESKVESESIAKLTLRLFS